MKNILLGFLIGAILATFAAVMFYQKQPNPAPTPVAIVTSIPTTPDTDLSPTLKPDNQLLLREALAQKHKLPVASVSVTIKEITSEYASGTVLLNGEGGWFLAAKENDDWQIVDDGNGVVLCDVVAKYNFPKSMVPECVDKNGNQIQL